MLYYSIDKMLPKKASPGNPMVYAVKGWVFSDSRAARIQVVVGDSVFDATDKTIYRPDVLADYLHIDRKLNSLFSGFRVPVVIEPVSNIEERDVYLEVTFQNGITGRIELGTLTLSPYTSRELDIQTSDDTGLVTICMTTYNPDLEQFRRQVESIRSQEYRNWICIVSDDCSKISCRKQILEILGNDERFIFIDNEDNVGFYHNFERCLERVPKEAQFVALADQDDYWYPNKLSLSVKALLEHECSKLVYCDMRIVKRDGSLIYDSYWVKRKNYYRNKDLDLLVIANTVTGAASVFRADILRDILPFPPRNGDIYHDQWIAMIASMRGGIEYIDEPLYDYVQSDNNVIGHTNFGSKPFIEAIMELRPMQEVRKLVKDKNRPLKVKSKLILRELYANMVSLYNFNHLNAEHIVTLAENAEQRGATPEMLKLIRRYRSVRGLWKVHRKVSRGKETLNNIELWMLVSLLVNRLTGTFVIPMRRWVRRLTQSTYATSVASQGATDRMSLTAVENPTYGVDHYVLEYKRKFMGRRFVVSTEAPRRVNLLISQIDPQNFFGGYIGMFNLAKKFYELGYLIRILMTDQSEFSKENLDQIKNHDGRLKTFLTDAEFQTCYSFEQEVKISESDIFIATSWWTAHLASEATNETIYSKFIYLAQDYEPIFYENGTYKVLAENSYRLDYYPIFSTDILQQYFVQSGIVSPLNAGSYFKNPILRFELSEQQMVRPSKRRKKKLLFYARPQPHNSRNLYALGCLAIDRARELGGFSEEEWEIIGIGGDKSTQVLPSGIRIKHIGKLNMDDYEELLPQHNLGLALMDSPHPSLLPIEMASAGLLVVTNTYGIKTAEYFRQISSNISAVPPDIESLAHALLKQSTEAEHYKQRLAGSDVNWPHEWSEALPDNELFKAIREVEESMQLAVATAEE
ncbi:MAG: glycosyltransferase [Candidatus Cohnella colombiensis]|uniref:Glycosyltransferase n=1 Tax=Candidatus Cohnella colombiensis TaxID=3121368 RepID=A0AA95EWD9_9BACL|nr:MAG: glycosyltransferase [Cohnella sp.]